MMFTEWQVQNCQMTALLRYCKWLVSQGKFDDDYLSLTRQSIIELLKLRGYVVRRHRSDMYG